MKNSKKIMSAILTALMVQSILTTGFAVTTSAYETSVNESTAQTQVQESKDGVYGDFEYSVSDGKVTITKYTGSDTEVTIPSEIEGVPVTVIGKYSFEDCINLTNVSIPDGVTTINFFAFHRCRSLVAVTIPDSVFIMDCPFSDCNSLVSVTLSNCLSYISGSAFEGCSSLTSITIPYSVKTVGSYAFYGCDSLQDVYYTGTEEQWNQIDIYSGNSKLKKAQKHYSTKTPTFTYEISDNQVTIKGCSDYNTEIVIPSMIEGKPVTSIGNSAFFSYKNLTSVIIPNSVTSIGSYAFYGCSDLVNVRIPDGITEINHNAFEWCRNLTSVTIPDSVNNIGEYAFEACINLEDVIIGNGIKNIASNTFSRCINLKNVTLGNNVTTIGIYAFWDSEKLTNITIPDSVVSIGFSAFGRSGLKDVTIGSGVTEGLETFRECNELINITVNDDNITYSSEDGILFNKDKTRLIFYPDGRTDSSYTIPDSVTSIDTSAFNGCSSLSNIYANDESTEYSSNDGILFNKDKTKLIRYPEGKLNYSYTIPDGVTSIEKYAFEGCYNLIDVTIPDFVTHIGDDAFSECAICNVIIQDRTTSLNLLAFINSRNLTDIYYEGTEEQWKLITDDAEIGMNVTIHYNCPNVTLDKEELTLEAGQMYTLTATANPPTETTFTWKSNNTTVATVNGSGRVVARGEGTATITVISSDGKRAYCTVTVSPKKEIVLDKTELNLSVKEQYTLNPSMSPEDTAVTYTFKSNNTAVATVNKAGRIVARGEGTATITVIGSNGLKAYCTVNVTPQKVLVLDKTELNLSVKEQYTLNPSIVPEDTEVTYTFKSDNTAVATVNKAGRIVARGTGTAKITVKSSNGLTAVCNITVE